MSIKNKFATAVATASLLAGLFGSAFVPSALAGRASSTPVVKPAVTEAYAGSDVTSAATTTATNAGKARVFGFYSGDNAGGDASGQVGASTKTTANDDASIGFELFSATTSGVGSTLFDFSLADGRDLDLSATSSNSGVLVAWAYDAAGANAVCTDLDGVGAATTFAATDTVSGVSPKFDTGSQAKFYLCLAAASGTTAATSTITVKANGITAVTVTVTAVGPIASVTLSAVDGKNVAEENDDVADFWQIVAKDAAGTVINGKTASTTRAAGVSTLDLDFINDSDNPENAAGTVIDTLYNGDVSTAYSGYAQYFALDDDICQADSGLAAGGEAEGDGDAGKSYALKVAFDADTEILSNSVTILCTGGWLGATVSSVSADVTSGDLVYEDADGNHDIYITGVIKDSAGRLMGAGLVLDDGAVKSASSDFTGSSLSFETEYETNGNGEIAIGDLQPDVASAKKYAYSVTVYVNAGSYKLADGTTNVLNVTAVTKKYSLTYTASDTDATSIVPTVKKNAAKTRATITVDCGVSDSMELVDWDVELANGDLIPYTRKANIDGVVKLSLSKRNTTVRVQAYCTDGDSEVKAVSFK